MKIYFSLFAALVMSCTALADWPQWRGPDRDGVQANGPALSASWGDQGPKKLWQSEAFPPENGSGSVVTSGGRAYVLVNWQEQVPTEKRRLDGRVQNTDLRVLDLDKMSPELVERLEASRASKPDGLGGSRLIKWIKGELPKILLTEEETKDWKGPVERRLREGDDALSLEVMKVLREDRKRIFPNEAALVVWLDEQGFSDAVKQTILEKVPKTEPIAEDILVCMDVESGETLWKAELKGSPDRTAASSTPCVVGKRVYALTSVQAVCVDAESGESIWSIDLPNGGAASSPVIVNDHMIFLAGQLIAIDVKQARIAWIQADVKGKKASPAHWRANDTDDYVIVHGDKSGLFCVEAGTGKLAWKHDGGGDSTPVIAGDQLIIHSAKEGIASYKLGAGGIEAAWQHALEESRGAASPLVYEDHVYLVGADTVACYHIGNGQERWRESVKGDISSPILADGKIFTLTNNGGYLTALAPSPAGYRELGKVRMRLARCPSPALSGHRLLLRGREYIECFDLSVLPAQ